MFYHKWEAELEAFLQSHITESWESHSPLALRKEESTVEGKSERRNSSSRSKPSFKSHVANAEGSLIDLS